MDYNWANGNFMPDQPPRPDVDIDLPQESMPQQIPREAQGMPDVAASGRGDGMPDRKSLQQRAKDLGLPATGTTKEIARMVGIGEKSPYEWTREEFNEIAPHLSVHQDIRPGSDARAQQIMERGLQSGMVDSVGAWGRNHTWAGGKMAGDNAYLFVSSKLKYRPGNLNPWLDEGNIPIARIKTKPGQTDIYEALIASRPQATPSAAPRAQAMPDSLESVPTDQLQRQYEENQGYLGLSTLGMREGRPVRGGAAQTRELLRRNEAISAELERRGVRSEDPQLQRALQRRGQAMPDTSGIDETKHIIAYRGGPSGAGDFPGTFVSTSAEAAGQYGDVSAVGVPRGLKVLSIEDSEAMQLAKRFARKHPDEAAALNNDVLAGEEPADLFMFPTKKWTALLKSEGYHATQMGEDLFVFDGIKLQKPKAAPRGQAMPDAPVSGRGDGMLSAPRRYVPMEQFINEAGDDLGAVLANAYADMDINEDRNALVGFVDTRNSMYRQRIPVKEFFDWLHSDEPMRGLVFDSENKPATAGEGASYTREGYEALLNRLRDISLRKPKK
jgi:hypothetical protein